MMRIFTLLLSICLFGSINAQEIIWGGPGDANGEFDGGLNDWTAISVSPNDSALWVWEADGVADRGAYSTNIGPINSPSVANGAAVFDSDFYDNRGMTMADGQPVAGAGQAASPQVGELLSPVFSTLGENNISIVFNQYTRKYNATNNYAVHVTTDAGATWTVYTIASNNAIATNQSTATDSQIIIDISDSAADKAEVQFKFVWNANYYFWVIDDVAVIRTPAVDLVATNMYYPLNAYQTPKHMSNSDTLQFGVELTNQGSESQSGGVATVNISDANGVIYTATQDFGAIDVNDTMFVEFDDEILPADVNLEEGSYTISYEVASNDGEDAVPGNNGLAENAIISTDIWAANNGVTGANSFNGSLCTYVNVFRTGTLPEDMEYVTNAVLAGGASNGGFIDDSNFEVILLKVLNQETDELDPVFEFTTYPTEPGDDEHPNLEFVGFSFSDNLEGSDTEPNNFDEFTVPMFDAEGDNEEVILEENTTYLIGVRWNFDNNVNGQVFHNSSTRINFLQNVSIVHVDEDRWYTIDDDLAWGISPTIISRVVIDNEETELAEDVVSIYPSPASEFTNVDLSFETPTNVAIILRDAKGGYISTKSVENVTNETVRFDVAELPSGMYNFEIRTSNNEVSVKTFVVVK